MARFLSLLGFLCAAAPAMAQPLSPRLEVAVTIPANTSEAQIEEYYKYKNKTLRELTPRIIFIPGILGSKIFECQPDGSQCKAIWGTVPSITNPSVDLTIRDDRYYKTDVVESIFFKDVYGDIIDHIRLKIGRSVRDSANDPMLTVFHYDWRKSNRVNADALADRICNITASSGNAPIVIIAHSMGGLILKFWLKDKSSQKCSNETSPNLKSVIFVATPHLGSPKSIRAFTDGYNLLFDEVNYLSNIIGYFETNYLLRSLNSAGMRFKSLYELLPIQSSEYCRSKKPSVGALSRVVVDSEGAPVNIFDENVWKRYDILRRLGAAGLRSSFYNSELIPMLKSAESGLCDLVDFNPSTITDVVYIVGREAEDNTFSTVIFSSENKKLGIQFGRGPGDGTVPLESAENMLVSRTIEIKEDVKSHVNAVTSRDLFALIDDIYVTALAETKIKLAQLDDKSKELVVAETAATGELIRISTDVNGWRTPSIETAVSVNSAALSKMGYTAEDVAKFASLTLDPQKRGELFAIAATTAEDQSDRLAWTAEVARAAYISGGYETAIANADFVLDTVEKSGILGNDVRATIKTVASEAKGWSYFRMGDLDSYAQVAKGAPNGKLGEPRAPLFFAVEGGPVAVDNYVGNFDTNPFLRDAFEQLNRETKG